ncbi:hypothetical protein L3Y34_003623 [Caenorhabditis briggsae]|uniref:Uncharacterized protein n=1 Tax=Caenorhabditis briggsae TaxID=6238 RepID=A0AAE9D640_CAEBR|nr:hypothetical protein L3Y34_003623 [Caenorhabditis briggsae]
MLTITVANSIATPIKMNLDLEIESVESADFYPVRTNPKLPIFTIVATIILLPLSAFFIILGSFTLERCSMEHYLPIWMILLGTFLAIDRAFAWIFELNLYFFMKDNTKPVEELEMLNEWEFKKSGLELRVSNYTPVTVCGLLFFSFVGTYFLQNVWYIPESGDCNDLLILTSIIFCSIILLPCFLGLIFLFIYWIFLWLLSCFFA